MATEPPVEWPTHDGVLDAEPIQGHADPAFLVRGLVAAAGPGW
ncbi:hypothetical protein AB0J63_46105 [Streptosporangium canum]